MFDVSLLEEFTRFFGYILLDNAIQLPDFNSCSSEKRIERERERDEYIHIFLQ